MGLQLLVGGVDLSAYNLWDKWSIQQNWGRQGVNASFVLEDELTGSSAMHFHLQQLQTVAFSDTTLGATLFGGLCPTPSLQFEGPTKATWQLACRDYTYFADKTLVSGDYYNRTADYIIKDLVANAACGFTTVNVQPGPVIARCKINYLSLSRAWDYVTQFASQDQPYGWYVDESLDLHWYSSVQVAAPSLTVTNSLSGVMTASRAYYEPSSFRYYWDAGDLRNVVTVRGGNKILPNTDSFVADGISSSWPMTYPLDTNPVVATLTVGGVAATVSTAFGTVTTQYGLTRASNGAWFLTVGTDPIPPNGTALVLAYNYTLPVLVQVSDPGSISLYSGLPNSGRFASYVTNPNITEAVSAISRGNRELTEFADHQERVEFTIAPGWPGHVQAGQLITFQNLWVPDSQNSWAQGVTDTFFIVQIAISGVRGGYRAYKCTAVRMLV